MSQQVQFYPVTVYQDMTLAVYPSGCTRNIDCNVTKVSDETISLTAGGNNCIIWRAGDVWNNGVPEGVDNVVVTVKMKTPQGFIWISPASYTSFLAQCNSCCL